MNCPRCNTPNARDCGQQKGIELSTRRPYEFTVWNCDDGCGSSFGADKHYTDGDGEPVHAKAEVA